MTAPEAVAAKLKGTLKKYTVAVYLKDGRMIEVQSDEAVRTDYDTTARDAFLKLGYGDANGFRLSDVAGWTTTPNEFLPEPQPEPKPEAF